MTPLADLYDSIAARLASLSGVSVRTRMPAIEVARWREATPLVAVSWLGREMMRPEIVGSSWQRCIMRWGIDIVYPGSVDDRRSAEDGADALALQIADLLAPQDHSWRPATDCSAMWIREEQALGDTQQGYVVSLVLEHEQWR
jgi:hypothetical protein